MLRAIAFGAAALLCSTVPAAAAATDRQVFQGKVAKVAPPAGENPKALCFCLSASSDFQGRVGSIRQTLSSGQVFAVCAVDTFNTAGADIGGFTCSAFMPLVK
jgi:hypothetical protein